MSADTNSRSRGRTHNFFSSVRTAYLKSVNFLQQRNVKLLGGKILKANQIISFSIAQGAEPQPNPVMFYFSGENASISVTRGSVIRLYATTNSGLPISINPAGGSWGVGMYQYGTAGILDMFDNFLFKFYARISFTDNGQYVLNINQIGNDAYNSAQLKLTITVTTPSQPPCGTAIGGGGI